MTLDQFTQICNVKFHVRRVDSRPGSQDWAPDSRHFYCIIKRGPDSMRLYFSQGSAHTEDPTLEDVLDCLASDTANLGSFEDFCGNFGYDTDSRKAHKAYQACYRELKGLQRLFSGDELETLWFKVDRL